MKECPACSRCYPDHVNHCPADGGALRLTIAGDTLLGSRYQLERRLGQGGMGVVFKGRHVFLKTAHAIKIILPDLVGNDPGLVTRFRQEAMAAAAIRHQNIISVTDFDVVNNTMPFLVMEFLEGRSLHELLAAEKRMAPARAIEIMLAVAAGVGAAHSQGIVHRDLKPLNIMLKEGCSAAEGLKVLDFGLAKIKSGDLLGSFVAAQTQGLMGSPFYMAPEQWGDEEPDARADIYSLGIILYQMLAGEVPFKGNSIPSIMKKHLSEPPPPFAAKGVAVPPEVERVVRHALEKEPDKRPQAVVEFSLELLQALAAVSGPNAPSAVKPEAGSELEKKTELLPEPAELFAEPAATPHGSPEMGGQTAGAFVAGHTSPEVMREPDTTPRSFETVPPTEAPRTPQTSPASDYTEARPTSHDIAAGGTALIPDAQDDGGRGAIVEPPSAPTSTPASSFSSSSSLSSPSSPSLPPPPSQPSAGPGAGSPDFTESPSFYASPADLQGFQTTPLNVSQPSQFQESQPQPTAAERGEPPPASPPPTVARHPHVVPSVVTPARSRVPIPAIVGAGVLALLCVVAGLYFAFKPTEDDAEANTNVRASLSTNINANRAANTSANANVGPTPAAGFKPDLVSVPGGAFMMGRNDVPPRSSQVSVAYQAWVYNQWPAHPVNVLPFSMDRTEVTNGEYAEFVEKTGHAPPAHWGGKRPPAGQEKWPVGGVALADAEAFARWRSERDGAQYRLPTEEEWEYAARGGDATRLYPWGAEWADGRANLEADSLRDVGSFPEGATPQGALDMLGNVWEWTSTEAGMYRGNNLLMLAAGDRGKVVVRGGSYQSKARGEEPITSTARRWVPRTERNPLVGFRLVRAGS